MKQDSSWSAFATFIVLQAQAQNCPKGMFLHTQLLALPLAAIETVCLFWHGEKICPIEDTTQHCFLAYSLNQHGSGNTDLLKQHQSYPVGASTRDKNHDAQKADQTASGREQKAEQ